eukprot:5902082-Amphidinium_carterae.1
MAAEKQPGLPSPCPDPAEAPPIAATYGRDGVALDRSALRLAFVYNLKVNRLTADLMVLNLVGATSNVLTPESTNYDSWHHQPPNLRPLG